MADAAAATPATPKELYGLDILPEAEGRFDLVTLGGLVHRLDSGVFPMRKATKVDIHVSGGEFNTAANLSDCFGMNTAVVSARVNYPVGDLIHERVRAMGVTPFYKEFEHNGVRRPPPHGNAGGAVAPLSPNAHAHAPGRTALGMT